MIAEWSRRGCGGTDDIPSVPRDARVERTYRYSVCNGNIRCKRSIWHQVPRAFAWRQRRLISTHAFSDSFPELRVADLGHFVGKPTVRQFDIVPLISGLNISCGPSAVVRPVISIVVDPVYGQRVRVPIGYSPIAERLIAISPRCVNSDAATSIVHPSEVVRVGASVQHTAPNSEKPCAAFAVLGKSSFRNVAAVAPARLCAPFSEFLPVDDGLVSALTNTSPCNISFARTASPIYCCQSAKHHSSQVDKVSIHSMILTQKRKGGWA
mgnify:CR=1 FL=1